MLACAALLGNAWEMGLSWWLPYALMVLALGYIHFFRRSDDLDALNRDFFLANVGISVTVFLGLCSWIFLAGGLHGLVS